MPAIRVINRQTLGAIVLVVVGALLPGVAGAAKHALVIGNSAYAERPLQNPRNDARDMARVLKGLGYRIAGGSARLDLDGEAFDTVLSDFTADVRNGDTAVFYFAGHGASARAQNYLIPTGERIGNAAQLRHRSVSLQYVVDSLKEANPDGINALFINACRDNPFGRSYRTGSRGLARVDAVPAGVFIGLAAGAGQVAADNDATGRNGLYTGALLAQLQLDPGRGIENLHKAVAREVYSQSRGSDHPQRPTYRTDLLRDRCIGPCAEPEPEPEPAPAPQSATARFAVKTLPPGASVILTNQIEAYRPGMLLPVGADVEVYVTAAGYQPYRGRHSVTAGQSVVWVELEPAKGGAVNAAAIASSTATETRPETPARPPAPEPARLTVVTTPPDARVRILNIVPKYQPGMVIDQAEAVVEVSKPGYAKRVQRYPLSPGAQTLRISLTKARRRPYEPEMVDIPGGRFRMGCLNDDGACFGDEKPVRSVSIKGFRLSKFEVTFAQYDAYVKATGARRPSDRGWGRGTRPVINVSWDDAQGYIAWLNRETGKRYRLPSESEWEYAARAGSRSRYSWGDAIGGANRAHCRDCGSRRARSTVPVGSFEVNRFGVFDLHGNVSEWVEDGYHGSYKGAPTDGLPWASGDDSRRVLRGGGWINVARFLRTTNRNSGGSSKRYRYSGFRLAED